METRRLHVLLELARHGSMREVAERLQISTSTVSGQIAALAREAGTPLIEPVGRRVRLTPAGRRLAAHAVQIVAAVDAAYADLEPGAEPVGTVRVAGFASAILRSLLPVIDDLAISHPQVRVVLCEAEPDEARTMLANDSIDLALIYDYTLAPARIDDSLTVLPLWEAAWCLGVPTSPGIIPSAQSQSAAVVFEAYRDRGWIGNSRNMADEQVVRLIASLAGFEPKLTHTADSLDLVEELIVAGMGVGLLPADRPVRAGVTLLPLTTPDVRLRASAAARRGHTEWPPLRLIMDRLAAAS